MVRLRLSRFGGKKSPTYRVVATDSRSPRDGRFIERLGHFNPMGEGTDKLVLQLDRVDYWLSQGAQPSDTVRSLIARARASAPAADSPAQS